MRKLRAQSPQHKPLRSEAQAPARYVPSVYGLLIPIFLLFVQLFFAICTFFHIDDTSALGKSPLFSVHCAASYRTAAVTPALFSRNPPIMKDELGLYYHPQAGNSLSRVYVRRGEHGEVEFRLWRSDMPEVWDRHPWLSMSVVQDAAQMYQQERNPEADPLRLYDLAVARALLKEDEA